jgi:hypothetical protein
MAAATAVAAAAAVLAMFALLTIEACVGQLQHAFHAINSIQQNLFPTKLRVGEVRRVAPPEHRPAADLLLRAIWQSNDQHQHALQQALLVEHLDLGTMRA